MNNNIHLFFKKLVSLLSVVTGKEAIGKGSKAKEGFKDITAKTREGGGRVGREGRPPIISTPYKHKAKK
jgi:hypothetical protein